MVNDLLNRTRPTLLFGVPAFFRGFAGLAGAELPATVRAVVSAGEALDVELVRAVPGHVRPLPLLDGLGSTEALHHVTSNRPDDVVPGSAGRALDGYEVQARDRDGQPLPEGDDGELWVRGPTTFAGYWRRPELTERAYQGEWMRTGDRVRIVDGRVYHAGRLDDLVKLGGIWVAPTEIEDVLRGHADVSDAAVIAVDDGSGVPVLKAFVVSEREASELSRELLRLCRSRLASFKVPQSFEVVDELPAHAVGQAPTVRAAPGGSVPAGPFLTGPFGSGSSSVLTTRGARGVIRPSGARTLPRPDQVPPPPRRPGRCRTP